jgi:FkbM family methyltransferase
MMPRVPYRVVRGPLKGTRLVLGSLSGEGGGASVYFNQYEPLQTASLGHVLKAGQLFFDIGANVGFYTLLGSRLVGPRGSVVAFEPVVRNLTLLHRHVELNACRNVSIIAAACSNCSALASFTDGENFATGHLDAAGAGAIRPDSQSWNVVPTVTIDSVAKQIGAFPDVMKIDVEGAELRVLEGAETVLRSKHPQLFLSIHSNQLRTNCLNHLAAFGYNPSPLAFDETGPTEYLLTHQR